MKQWVVVGATHEGSTCFRRGEKRENACTGSKGALEKNKNKIKRRTTAGFEFFTSMNLSTIISTPFYPYSLFLLL
jgi:hypothetical protein